MRRRRLLHGLGSALILPSLAGFSSRIRAQESEAEEAPERNVADVLVIGSGMAGIAAARELRQLGASVIVVEARDRIGGRTYTDREGVGVPVDLGAAWIHGIDGNPVTRLVADAGIQTVKTEWEWLTMYAGGEALTTAQFAQAQRLNLDVRARMRVLREGVDGTKAIAPFLAQAETELLAQTDARVAQAVRWIDWCDLAMDYAIEPAQLSARNWDEDEEYGGDHVLLREGYGTLVQQLAQGLDIRLQQIVETVEHGDDGVLLRCRDGSVYEADALVCSVPLGVLKAGDVRFDPPLPAAHRSAIERLGMGQLGKVVLRYPEAFWPSEPHVLGRIDSAPDRRCEFYNLVPVHDAPVLVALTTTAHTQAMERLSTAAAMQRIHGELQSMFGTDIPAPSAGLRTGWVNDPFSRGSYSAVVAGASLDDYGTLAEPAGDCVFLAGEATAEDYPGTVHGAWLSGIRAAGQVARLLG